MTRGIFYVGAHVLAGAFFFLSTTHTDTHTTHTVKSPIGRVVRGGGANKLPIIMERVLA